MKLTTDRFEAIKEFLINKSVLDLGCMQYDEESAMEDKWLHRKIEKVSKEVTGVDIIENKKFNIIKGDLQDINFDLKKKFDVIVAGELIEHMSNQGVFLDIVRKHMKKNGKFILSTPNAASLGIFIRRVLKLHSGLATSSEHVLLHDEKTLEQVLNLHGFKIIDIIYWQDQSYGKRKYFSPLLKLYPDMATNLIAITSII